MASILLVKTSSLGDVVHNFPVVSDIQDQFPGLRIDWVIEEAYGDLARLHPGVNRVIPLALRRWRRHLLRPDTWKEIRRFRALLNEQAYDHVIDTQGLIKSAMVTRMAHGCRHGFDAASARETLAAAFYDRRHFVERGQHAISRNRQLAALALGLRQGTGPVRYGLAPQSAAPAGEPSCVFLHATSRLTKLWPVPAWRRLALELGSRGYRCILPWGSEPERARSAAIADGIEGAMVPGRMQLGELTNLFGAAAAVIGVDTGLVHLAGALGRPTVAIFTGLDRQSTPVATGLLGAVAGINLGGADGAPSAEEVLDALGELGLHP